MNLKKGANLSFSMKEGELESLTPQLNAAIISKLLIAEVQEKRLARRTFRLQAVVTVAAAGITAYGWKSSPQYAMAVLCGGGVSVLNGVLLAWRMTRAALQPNHDAHQQLRLLYFYTAERFIVVATLLGVSLAVLKFSPLGILSGFVLGQTVLLLARLILKI